MNKSLIEKYRTNRLSPKELQEFEHWLKNADAPEVEKVIEEDMDCFNTDSDIDSDAVKQKVLDNLKLNLFPQRKSRFSLYKWTSIAAAILIPFLIFGNVYLYYRLSGTPDLPTTITTNSKRLATVELPDGSKVEINSNSRIDYSSSGFKKDMRTINFEGEGYFHIAKAKDAPFTINAEEMEVTVYGTEFNLRAYKDAPSAKLSLVDGSVTMTSKKSGDSVKLSPLETATLDYSTGTIAVTPMEPNENSLAWKTGKLRFDNTPLSEVVSQIEINYSCQIIYKKEIASEPYTGTIPMDDLYTALSILEEIYESPFSFKK